jgi:squalene-hopene/tetraprenyl-beta-curcumene cyclase
MRSILVACISVGLAVAMSPGVARADGRADPSAAAQKQVDKGLDFLKSQQKEDGGWPNADDLPGINALVLRGFVADARLGPKSDVVKKGFAKLLSAQVDDGGIYRGALANYNTAIAISALSAANDPDYKPQLDKAITFLKGGQITDKTRNPKAGPIDEKSPWFGGVGYDSRSRPDLSNTQMFIDALHDAGLKPDDPAFQNALKFVTRSQNLSEKNDQPWAGDDGGFVYTPVNGGQSNAGEYTGPDGKRLLRSYGLMTYAGLKSMIYAGLTKDDPRVKAAWAWIQSNWTLDENPGMRLAGPDNAKAGMYYYYNTLARALNAYDEPVLTDRKGQKHDWRVELVEKLGSLQGPDGSWVGDRKWMEQDPVLTTAFVVISLEEAQADLKQHPPAK